MKLLAKIASLLVVLAILCVTNGIIGQFDLPSYGTWTGIRPLEDKIKKLQAFAQEGPVDAVVFGSSIADFGFSAELYSKLMSEKLGRPYRAFNFATGGAELTTLPDLMNLALAYAHPKKFILIFPGQYKRPNEIQPNSPDQILDSSPVSRALKAPLFLPFFAALWHQPLFEKASALRDRLLDGGYVNLHGGGMDTYLVTEWGDRIAYGAIKDNADMARLRGVYENNLAPSPYDPHDKALANLENFFPQIDIDAIVKVRELARRNSVELTVFAGASAATLLDHPSQNEAYRKGRHQYFEALAQSLYYGHPVFVLDQFTVPNFGMMEDTHMNTYGASLFTQAVFAEESGTPVPPSYLLSADQSVMNSVRPDDVTLNSWSAAIVLKKEDNLSKLSCRFIDSIAVPPFPPSDLYLAVRMADGVDRMAPATKIGNNEYSASLNIPDRTKTEVGLLRLLYHTGDRYVAIPSPLASCRF